MNPSFPLPSYVNTALAVSEQNAHKAYLVGGCVRDLLRGVTPADYDLAVSSAPAQTERDFRDFRVIETGLPHGTVTVVIEGHNLELTTFRVDGGYRDSRHPDSVTFTGRLEDDLARRDFTVNAMAYRPDEGLVDLFGGLEDLRNGVIRCVGDPDARFTEDALRILRALRFASVLGFEIERDTAEALQRQKERLAAVSAERKFSELKKLLSGKNAGRVLLGFRPVLEAVLPALSAVSDEEYRVCARAAGRLRDPAEGFAALTAFLPDEDARAAAKALKPDNAFLRTVLLLHENKDRVFRSKGEARIFCGEHGEAALRSLLRLKEALSGKNEPLLRAVLTDPGVYPVTVKELAVNGRDLEEIGIKGPALGKTLNALLSAAAEGDVPNERAALLRLAQTAYTKF